MRPVSAGQRLPQLIGAAAAASALIGASTLRSEGDVPAHNSVLSQFAQSTSQMLMPIAWSDQKGRTPSAATAINDAADVPSRLKAWLESQGADVQNVEIRPSKVGHEV